MLHGYMMGVFSGAGGYAINNYGQELGRVEKIASSAVLGGVVSEIGGGKFANGAITAAYSMMFNEMMHRRFTKWYTKRIYENYKKSMEDYPTPKELYAAIGGPLGDWAASSPENFENGCAARLSYALNKAGWKIPKLPTTYKGADGKYYFISAKEMYNYFRKEFGAPRYVPKGKSINYGITYQTGLRGVSGHMDIFCNGTSIGHAYLFHTGERYHNTKTFLWRSSNI